MHVTRKTSIVHGLLIFLLAFFGTILAVGPAVAHQYSVPFKWYQSYANFRSLDGILSSEIQGAAWDYSSTRMKVQYYNPNQACPGACIYFNGQNLSGEIFGRARPYYQSTPCFDSSSNLIPGNCNTTNRKANLGYVDINRNTLVELDPYYNWFVRHEAGHNFGLAHPAECNVVSVMLVACSPLYNYLQQHDKDDLNANY